jgi:hypothetical protein
MSSKPSKTSFVIETRLPQFPLQDFQLPLAVCAPSLASILQQFTSYSCSASTQEPASGPPTALQNPTAPSQFSIPIQNVYQSACTLPALPSNPPSTSQPFLGFSALAPPSLPTQHANQAHLASAAATIPRQQQFARRGSRRRGPARPPPLPSSTTQPGQRLRTVF